MRIKYQVCARTDDETRTYGPYDGIEMRHMALWVVEGDNEQCIAVVRFRRPNEPNSGTNWAFFEDGLEYFAAEDWGIVAVEQPDTVGSHEATPDPKDPMYCVQCGGDILRVDGEAVHA